MTNTGSSARADGAAPRQTRSSKPPHALHRTWDTSFLRIFTSIGLSNSLRWQFGLGTKTVRGPTHSIGVLALDSFRDRPGLLNVPLCTWQATGSHKGRHSLGRPDKHPRCLAKTTASECGRMNDHCQVRLGARFENRRLRSPIRNQGVHHLVGENRERESFAVRGVISRGSERSPFATVSKQRVGAARPPSQTPWEMRDMVGSTWSILHGERQPDLS